MAARCFLEILSFEQLVIEWYEMLLGCVGSICDVIFLFRGHDQVLRSGQRSN